MELQTNYEKERCESVLANMHKTTQMDPEEKNPVTSTSYSSQWRATEAEDLQCCPPMTDFKIQRSNTQVSITPGKTYRNEEMCYSFSYIITITENFCI